MDITYGNHYGNDRLIITGDNKTESKIVKALYDKIIEHFSKLDIKLGENDG